MILFLIFEECQKCTLGRNVGACFHSDMHVKTMVV